MLTMLTEPRKSMKDAAEITQIHRLEDKNVKVLRESEDSRLTGL